MLSLPHMCIAATLECDAQFLGSHIASIHNGILAMGYLEYHSSSIRRRIRIQVRALSTTLSGIQSPNMSWKMADVRPAAY